MNRSHPGIHICPRFFGRIMISASSPLSQRGSAICVTGFNRLSNDRGISGPQAASCLLDLPDYYTLPTKVRHHRFRPLRYRFEHIILAEPGLFGSGEKPGRVTNARMAPRSFFDHYCWRGPSFSGSVSMSISNWLQ